MIKEVMVVVNIQGQDYLSPTWDECGQICFKLAKQILIENPPIDRVVALAKGGWTWAKAMSDYLGVKNIASIQYEFYKQIAETTVSPILKQPLPVSIQGERILIFDDIADSGKTLEKAVEYLAKSGADVILTSTLFTKPVSNFTPNYYGESTAAWIVFPHEIRETIELLNDKWTNNGMTRAELMSNLEKIGIDRDLIDYFLNNEKLNK